MTKQQRDDLNFMHGSIEALLFVVAREHAGLVEHILTIFERLKDELIEQD